MGRDLWGKTAGALVLAVVVSTVAGCGGGSEADSGKPAAATTEKAASVQDAAAAVRAAVETFDTSGGCLEPAPGTCWDQMQAVMAPARELRAAANADTETGPEFWSEAYALIDSMERGVAVGRDLGATDPNTNRPDVLGSAHKLVDWLTAHPIT
ncbi:hypothetical protein HHL19_35630 [Streptomyces sp. R302]|uniref:hypothetical protein n=1 Tax=unclassified Streptomyces TaxID=2593676 RepID=UPI00145DA32E|nr:MULTISPECIES: hypothetical protein [unclassified Streptomyces]NML55128.1 hypothetical protein [Streptomyces sp. R301]NML83842.1 hypothetical protein [Streptomyces sp. R302]